MDGEEFNILNIQSDEFKFLDYPNTFLSSKRNDNDFNKSASKQLEENLNELLKATNENKQHSRFNGKNELFRTNYLDELNDLKELKKIEDSKSYQQSLDRLSKLNLGNSNGELNNLARRFTFKTDSKSIRNFKSNNHFPAELNVPELKLNHFHLQQPKFDSSFDLRNFSEENEKTFIINNKLLNLSSCLEKQQDDVNDTFTIAKNYDEVQEIARKQEEALKKNNNNTFKLSTPNQFISNSPINNATKTKMKQNGIYKFDSTFAFKNLINENLINDAIKSPNLDGTFNLGNPMENGPSIKKPINMTQRVNNLVFNQKNVTNVKRILNQRNNLESKANKLNSSFIVSDSMQSNEDKNTKFDLQPNQFSAITKNKINKNLKRTNTFKVRETFQYASEENLTSNLTFGKNGLLNSNYLKSGLTNFQSIDDVKNYETIKLSQRKLNKLTNSKSNGNITASKTLFNLDANLESNENLNDDYKIDTKLPTFTSRLKAPSRMSILKSEEI